MKITPYKIAYIKARSIKRKYIMPSMLSILPSSVLPSMSMIAIFIAVSGLSGCQTHSGAHQLRSEQDRGKLTVLNINHNLQAQIHDQRSLLHLSKIYLAPMNIDQQLTSILPRERNLYTVLRDAARKELDIDVIVDDEYADSNIHPPYGTGRDDWAKKRAVRHGAQAILITRLNQYQDRVGSRVGITTPGKVNFQISLKNMNNDSEIWTVSYHYVDRQLSDDFLSASDYVKQRTSQSNKMMSQILEEGLGLAFRDLAEKRAAAFQ